MMESRLSEALLPVDMIKSLSLERRTNVSVASNARR